jgi:formylglycine-generating enzyme required for sulfatase activity
VCLALIVPAVVLAQSGMARLPAGEYVPLYASEPGRAQPVSAFRLDRVAVTRGEYIAFVKTHPEWQRGKIGSVYADAGYLSEWRDLLDAGDRGMLGAPVTSVSWFAARAYCEAQGKRLPTVDEWEYAASASETKRDATRDPTFIARLMTLYASRGPDGVAAGRVVDRNIYGITGLHGSVWEWTEDFNGVLVSSDSREAGGTTRHTDFRAVCAGGAIGASDPGNYPAFMRFAFRSSLTGRSSVRSLGFRCAANA